MESRRTLLAQSSRQRRFAPTAVHLRSGIDGRLHRNTQSRLFRAQQRILGATRDLLLSEGQQQVILHRSVGNGENFTMLAIVSPSVSFFAQTQFVLIC